MHMKRLALLLKFSKNFVLKTFSPSYNFVADNQGRLQMSCAQIKCFKFWEPIHAYGKFKHHIYTDCKIPKRPCVKFSIYNQWTNALFYKRVIEILTRSQANMGGREKRCQDIRQISACRDMLQSFEIAQ